MSRDDFLNLIDHYPMDHQSKLVFADWLEEQGDERYKIWYWMYEMERLPNRYSRSYNSFDWWLYQAADYHSAIPKILYPQLRGSPFSPTCMEYDSYKEAYLDLELAWTKVKCELPLTIRF